MSKAPVDALVRHQDELQHEAHYVLDELGVLPILARIGQPTIVGSLALGLMAWRDIDIEVQCPNLTVEIAFAAGQPLAAHPGMYRMNFRDWAGTRAVPELPAGFYWGLRYQPPGREE